MSTNKWGWKAGTVSRALAVAQRAGLPVTGYVIAKDGTITVMTGRPADGGNAPNPWEQTVADLENDIPSSNSKSSKPQPAITPR
jgi:hypothetical protein